MHFWDLYVNEWREGDSLYTNSIYRLPFQKSIAYFLFMSVPWNGLFSSERMGTFQCYRDGRIVPMTSLSSCLELNHQSLNIIYILATWRRDYNIFSWFSKGSGSLMAVTHQLLSRHEKDSNLLLWIWFQLHSMPKMSFKLTLFEQFPLFMPLVIFAHGQWIMPKYGILRRPCCSEIIFF